MNWFFKALTTGIVSFAATNVDDIFVLTFFFSHARKDRWRVVAGQYLGFFALVAISLTGYLVKLIVSPAWIGLLGFVPIFLGIRALVRRKDDQQDTETATGVMSVAALTFANGGDNIGIYTPLFASSSLRELVVILGCFVVLLAAWCVAGYFIGNRPLVQRVVQRYAHIIVPFVLIGLGVYILINSHTLSLLASKV